MQKMAERCVVWCAAVGDGKCKRSGMGKRCSVRPSNEGVSQEAKNENEKRKEREIR